MSVTITGYSDDLIEVDGDIAEEFNIVDLDDDTQGGLLAFSDGTVLRVVLHDVWRITPVVLPTADALTIVLATEGDEDNYSDVATLTRDIRWVMFGTRIEMRP